MGQIHPLSIHILWLGTHLLLFYYSLIHPHRSILILLMRKGDITNRHFQTLFVQKTEQKENRLNSPHQELEVWAPFFFLSLDHPAASLRRIYFSSVRGSHPSLHPGLASLEKQPYTCARRWPHSDLMPSPLVMGRK
ncbi:hypothetical protein AVEN_102454-1 [Araneus ventricosus]|uniref:Uncharacterized protein n=1 Tax=Araneus ventricosus TaxID=182803 RepID=A0A4Y2R6K9_ARAVE|nr:hypothetical protein AVEN_102454-1 [Araneus ventricosus]